VIPFGIAALAGFLVLWPLFWLFASTLSSSAEGLTFNHWRGALASPQILRAAWNTVLVSCIGTAIAVATGIPLAYLVARTDLPGARFFELVALAPFITPPIVSGIAWTILADREGGLLNLLLAGWTAQRLNVLSFGGLVFVSSLYMVPFVFFIVVGAMRHINAELEEASQVCGASRTETFFRVTLPLLVPSISSGALLAFMYSNNLFGIHAVIGMPAKEPMLTTAIYSSMSVMPVDFGRAAIQSLILVVLAAVAIGAQRMLTRRRSFTTLGGKGFRASKLKLGRWRWAAFAVFAAYVFVVVLLPYLVLALRSLSVYTFQPGTGPLDWLSTWDLTEYWNALAVNASSQRAIWNSFWLSSVAGAFTVALTAVAAYVVRRSTHPARHVLSFICMVPLALPGVVLGAACIFGYTAGPFALYGTMWILLLAYVMKDLPLAYQTADSAYAQVDPELEDSARVCGAGWMRRFATILLPLVKPGLVIGYVLVFASMMREVGASILLFSPGNEVFAFTIFNAWEEGRWQAMTSFILINTAIVLLGVFFLLRLNRLQFAELAGRRGLEAHA
jgi:iron(III) transport system permease protein